VTGEGRVSSTGATAAKHGGQMMKTGLVCFVPILIANQWN